MIQALWSLDQQFQNKNGSILTHGKIYVYYKGRTALATTYNDEDGTVVNPNPILLDNNGRAACFASSAYSYTIVVCDAYGKELFSYDLTLHDVVETADKVFIIGSDGSVVVDPTTLPNGIQYDLSVNTDIIATKQSVDDVKDDLDDLTDVVNNHTIEIGHIQDDIDDIEDTLANKKDKQDAKTFNGAATKTVKKITQNADGEMNVEFEDIDLPPEVPNVEITSPNSTIDVQSSTDVQTNTKTFEIDIKNGDPVWHYWTGNNAWTTISTASWTQINRPAIGAGTNPHPWNPDIKRGIYDAKAHFTVTFHNANNSKTVPNQIIQVGFRAKFVGKNDPTAIRYEDLGAWTYDPTLYTTEPYQYNFAQESIRQNHDTSKILNVANYWGDTDFNVYFEAALLNTDGGVGTPQSIDTVLFAEITYFGYHEIKGAVQAAGGGTEYTGGQGITIDDSDDTISVDAGEGLTFVQDKLTVDFDEVNEHQVQSDWNESDTTSPAYIQNKPNIPTQVQSDWTESDSSDPAYIKHKPSEKTLLAGSNITITDTNNGVRIDAAGGTQVQSNWNESDTTSPAYIQNKPNMSDYATDTELSTAVQDLERQIQSIPAQEQANWTESDTTDPSYIQNKPTEKPIVAGQNVTITEQSAAIEISATGGSTYTGGTGIDVDNTNDVISLEAPVDVVAGPGIVIDNPDGNTLRISSEADAETVLADNINNDATSFTLSEKPSNFERIRIYSSKGPICEVQPSDSYLTWHCGWIDGPTGYAHYRIYQATSSNGTSWSGGKVYGFSMTNNSTLSGGYGASGWYLETSKIVGIHRIANN